MKFALPLICMGLDVLASEITKISASLREQQMVPATTQVSANLNDKSTPSSSSLSRNAIATDEGLTASAISEGKEAPYASLSTSEDRACIQAPLTAQESAVLVRSNHDVTTAQPPAELRKTSALQRESKTPHDAVRVNTSNKDSLGHVEECMALLREVQTSAQSAVDVLNDMLNYDKIERRDLSLDITVIPVWYLIEGVVNEFRLPATNKELAFDWSVAVDKTVKDEENGLSNTIECLPDTLKDLTVVGDVVRLKQVLRNLV